MSHIDLAIGTDSAYVTVQETAELENPSELLVETGLAEGEEIAEPPIEEQMNGLVIRVLQALQQIHQAGDNFVAIAVNPEIVEAFTTAFRGLPEEAISPDVRDRLPIVADDSVNPLRVITGSELELQFFQQRYGPRENGGNGFIQDMQAALDRERSPVRLTHDFLRMYYLLDLSDKTKPKLYSPTGAEVMKTMAGLRR